MNSALRPVESAGDREDNARIASIIDAESDLLRAGRFPWRHELFPSSLLYPCVRQRRIGSIRSAGESTRNVKRTCGQITVGTQRKRVLLPIVRHGLNGPIAESSFHRPQIFLRVRESRACSRLCRRSDWRWHPREGRLSMRPGSMTLQETGSTTRETVR